MIDWKLTSQFPSDYPITQSLNYPIRARVTALFALFIVAWLWLDDLPISDAALYQRLKQERVIVVPGNPFFLGLSEEWAHTQQCVRISLTASEADLEEGVRIMAQVFGRVYDS